MPSLKFDTKAAKLKTCQDWLSNNPCPPDEPGGECINLWIAKAVGALHYRKCPAEKAVELVRAALTRPEKFPTEVSRTVERKYGNVLAQSVSTTRRPEVPYSQATLEARASVVPATVNTDWLIRNSPI